MNDDRHAEDSDPLQPNRTAALFVPARPGPTGYLVRLFRTPVGVRTAVAFTDERRLAHTLGGGQAWVRLSEPAIRALVAPLGVVDLVVDPLFAAPKSDAALAVGPFRQVASDRAVGPIRASARQPLSAAAPS
ncbi:SAV_915 family protein [Streptomyces sp. NPDC001822]|uniref:SAV_915 family protein n=1 Tax=Streptomyces sp. NPDC001822 TaxID=3364614 RepID=UPI003685D085